MKIAGMILVIDAYNILKQLVHGTAVIDQNQRSGFIRDLNAYVHTRNLRPLVVFDGGPSRWPIYERYAKVDVVYPGSGQSADAYILDYIHRSLNKDLLLVSSDTALNQAVGQHGVPSIDAPLFWALMQRALKKQARKKAAPAWTVKLTDQENPELDTLMMATHTQSTPLDDEELSTIVQHTHNQLSKNDRKLFAKLKKLL